MKRRHVRTAAVCGLVVIALTGASGCGALFPKAKVNVPSDGPTSGTLTEAESDITITSCSVDASFGTLEAKLRVHNGNSRSRADYIGMLKFRDDAGNDVGMANWSTDGVGAGETRPLPVSYKYSGLDDIPKHVKCKLDSPFKSNDEANG
ncbi:hypothetical protein ACIRPT_15720 [Streptomyces sp. NPDC101227]|uniref:hypothetical protein n=1 Tax=Streptomyces sp. NPDC101227 TaxID=3366136 RepID=UPI003808A5E0